MPNHTQQRMIVTGDPDAVHEAMEYIKGAPGTDNELIDLERIVPLPLPIQKTCELVTLEILCIERTAEEWTEFKRQIAAAHAECFAATGFPSWYEWCTEHWGTKWNVYSIRKGATPNELFFQSAWDPIVPAAIALSDRFPLINIYLEYVDEGKRFIGCSYLSDRKLKYQFYDWHAPEAVAIRARLWGSDNDDEDDECNYKEHD